MQFDVKNSNGRFTLRLILEEGAYSIVNNTSPLDYKLVLIANTSYHFSGYKIGYTIKLNGKAVASLARADSESLSIAANGTLTLCSGTYVVTHNSDGSLEDMPVAWSIDMASADYTPGSLSGSGTMDLTTIPRASTIAAANANIGEVSTIVVTRKSSTFTHSIAYKFGSLSGYIKADGSISAAETKITATSIDFAVPTAFYAQIPDAKSGKCTLTIKTYSGSTQVGDAQTATFIATAAPSACAPAISATAKDTNAAAIALTGSTSKILKGISDVLVESTATAKNSATIASVSVVCGYVAQSGASVTFEGAESADIKVTAKDSRGYSTTVTVSGLSLIEYFKPTVAVSVQRESQTSDVVQISVVGKWFNGSLGAVNNALTATMQYMKTTDSSYSTAQSMTLTTSGESFTGSMEVSGLDYQTEYYFRFYISDQVYVSGGAESPIRVIVKLPKGVPAADWGEDDWRFNVPVYLSKLNLQTLMEAMTTSYTLDATAEAGTGWTVADASAVLVGNNLRVYFAATRAGAAEGNITNEKVCTLTINTGGKITAAFAVGFSSANVGGVAAFSAAPSMSGDVLTLTITLAATATAVTDTNAYFVVPVLLDLCDREISCVVDASGVLRVYVEGTEVEAVVDSTGDLTWPGLVPKIYSNGAMQLREG